MKKFYLLTKTLLVAALLMVGASNAWADATTLYERGTTNAWSDADLEDWTNNWASTYQISSGLAIAGGNGDNYVTKSISTKENSKLVFTATWNTGSSTGNAGNYNYLRFGDVELQAWGQAQNSVIVIGGVSTTLATSQDDVRKNASWVVSITIDKAKGSVNYDITLPSSGKKTGSGSLASTDFSSLAMGFHKGGRTNSNNSTLTAIQITEEEQSIVNANYTVHFVDNNSVTVKDDVVRKGEVGAAVGANPADKASFIADGNKYVYSSDGGGTTVTNDGTAEFTVTYTKYVSTSYAVKAQVSGSDLTTLASGSAYFDGSTTEYWSKYINVEDKWYVADDATYGAAITTATTNVAYTATDAIDYFFEYEDMSYSGTMVGADTGTSYSGGDSKRFGANGKKWTTALAGGTYTLNLYCCGNNGKAPTLPMYYCDPDGTNEVYIGEATACNATTWALKEKTNVVIPDGKALCFYNNTSSTHNYKVDYITLKRTGDAEVSVEVTDAGYATYVPSYDLDFSATDIKAYKAQVNTTTGVITLTQVNNVPAGTPVVLYYEGGKTEYIPVMTGASAVSDNDLKAGNGAAVATEDGAGHYNYVLDDVVGIGFYKANGVIVASNRAYLQTTYNVSGPAARGMSLVFADDILTGINEAEASTEAVVKEGKFFVNGQLRIFKKGQMFNANGQLIK